ncbi:MAG: amylo-alpha-1,6-glucosidase [Ktedonobacteraceae bacterium]
MITEQDTDVSHRAPTNAWNLYVGRDICTDVAAGLDHEWLMTNGLGGYAGGSLVGATTRSYHGLLVAALRPPVERTVLVTKIDETVEFADGHTLKLGVNEYQDGTIDPQGYNFLDTVALEGDVPRFTYILGGTLTLEKRVWMEYGQNTTYVQYTLHGALDEEDEKSEQALTLVLSPYCLCRDHHSTTQGAVDWRFLVDNQGNKCSVRAYEGAAPTTMIAGASASFTPTGMWYWKVLHRREQERGLPATEDVYQPGYFRIQIVPGMRTTLVLSAEGELSPDFGGQVHEEAATQALLLHHRRIKQLLTVADRSEQNLLQKDPILARLAVAADQFIVARPEQTEFKAIGKESIHLAPDRKTIIAGYPWFTDWGRDTMISLPGLLLDTGRYSEARGLLKAFASFTQNGLIPNRFPDHGEAPEYNTADATLWMFHALDSYLATTGDWMLLKELFSTMRDIIAWHVRGTSYGIGVDANDGLLHEGEAGLQLTWMDAKVDDWVVTPRRGKPVEINALWYRALTAMESWAVRLSTDATQYSQLRMQVRQNFATRFWYEDGGYLYDVVDVDGKAGQHDASLRPNQLFAGSLTRDLLSEAQMSSMLQQVTEHLLTPLGLRSLSPEDANYHKHFNGKREERDRAYHQGAVWQWLMGPYIDVHLRVHNDRRAVRALLEPVIEHLWSTCLGTISEVAEPEVPFTPAGCFAQAWSVAEVLRCWHLAAE